MKEEKIIELLERIAEALETLVKIKRTEAMGISYKED